MKVRLHPPVEREESPMPEHQAPMAILSGAAVAETRATLVVAVAAATTAVVAAAGADLLAAARAAARGRPT